MVFRSGTPAKQNRLVDCGQRSESLLRDLYNQRIAILFYQNLLEEDNL